MKKFLLLFLCLVMCVAPLASCRASDDTAAPDTTASETTGGGTELPSAAPVYETRTLTPSELGYTAQIAKSDNRAVADVVVTENGGVTISSHKPGVANITVRNAYSEVVEIKATVAANGSFSSVEFDKFEMPENYVFATDFGISPRVENNTPYFQAAIDSLAGGGTVYVPRGIYNLTSRITMREGIIFRLEGCYENYNTEISDRMVADIKEGRIAVISATKTDLFINHPAGNNGRNGADNFALYGGCLDMTGTQRCFVLVCADNVTIENTILKDCPNNHAVQITGSKNVTFRNVMFAGYKHTGSSGSCETIQIEASTNGAIGGTTSNFDGYEYYYGENVLIENCYFGPSDELGSHQIPLGHHGHAAHASVEGLRIINCTFDNPSITAIRAYAWSGIEIAGCKFISTDSYLPAQSYVKAGIYMIELTYLSGNVTVDGTYLALGYERTSCNGVNIHDNSFYIGPSSQMGGILMTGGTLPANANSTSYSYDVKAESGISVSQFITNDTWKEADGGTRPSGADTDSDADKDKIYTFTGYKMVKNRVSDLIIANNDIKIENTQSAYLFNITNVKGYQISNNTVSTKKALTNNGLYASGCTALSTWQKKFVVSAKSANTKPIVMMGGETNINAYCTSGSPTVTFSASGNGKLERWTDYDGNLYVKPVADSGYVFDGYYVNSSKISSATYNFSSSVTIEARFVAK